MRGRGKLSGTPVYWTNFHSEVIFNFVLGVKDLSLIFAVHLQGVLLFAEGSVVQLVRMPPCHGGGRGFESRPVRNQGSQQCGPCFILQPSCSLSLFSESISGIVAVPCICRSQCKNDRRARLLLVIVIFNADHTF